MAYCNQDNVEQQVTPQILAQLTDDTNGTTVDTSVLDEKIALAESEINGYLRGKHSVPYADGSVPAMVRNWCVVITAWHCYSRRSNLTVPENLEKMYKNAVRQLKEVQSGQFVIDDDSSVQNTAAFYKSNKTSSSRIFTSNDNQNGLADKYFSSCRLTP